MNTAAGIGSAFNMKTFTPKMPEQKTVYYAGKSLFHTHSGKFSMLSSSTALPDGSMSAEDFMKQLFPDLSKQELFDIFKQDLGRELAAGAISKIKHFRLLSQMTQFDLADKTGMKQANIARIESVGYAPTLKTIQKIAAAFAIDVKELL